MSLLLSPQCMVSVSLDDNPYVMRRFNSWREMVFNGNIDSTGENFQIDRARGLERWWILGFRFSS
ncbi:MAG: hypothetical protein R2865_10615 [Deinococcales bacterium]